MLRKRKREDTGMLLTAFKGNNNTSKTAYRPDHVISFGQKPLIDRLYIEPVACSNGEILESAFSISALKDSLSAYGIPFEVSDNPSNYLCNHAYYHGLQYIEKNRLHTKMVFIHVPGRKRFKNMDVVAAWLHDFCGDRL